METTNKYQSTQPKTQANITAKTMVDEYRAKIGNNKIPNTEFTAFECQMLMEMYAKRCDAATNDNAITGITCQIQAQKLYEALTFLIGLVQNNHPLLNDGIVKAVNTCVDYNNALETLNPKANSHE